MRSATLGPPTGFLAVLAAALAAAPVAIGQPAGGLDVEVRGLRSEHGQVLCFLYARAAGVPADPGRARARDVAPIVGQGATCRFAHVAPGAYALAVAHDENGNGRLDRNLLGVPTEGVGASNNPVTHFGSPSFAQARFDYAGGPMRLTVQIHYL